MYCKRCGCELKEKAQYCVKCGSPCNKDVTQSIQGKKKYNIFFAVFLLLILALVSISQVFCFKHEWKEATCVEGRKCLNCGKIEGEAIGHVWESATCEEKETCRRCGVTQGEALGHDWQDATCLMPRTCKICGSTQGETTDHYMTYYSCTEDRCENCGYIQEVREHDFDDLNICLDCGYDDEAYTLKLSFCIYERGNGENIVEYPGFPLKDYYEKTTNSLLDNHFCIFLQNVTGKVEMIYYNSQDLEEKKRTIDYTVVDDNTYLLYSYQIYNFMRECNKESSRRYRLRATSSITQREEEIVFPIYVTKLEEYDIYL